MITEKADAIVTDCKFCNQKIIKRDSSWTHLHNLLSMCDDNRLAGPKSGKKDFLAKIGTIENCAHCNKIIIKQRSFTWIHQDTLKEKCQIAYATPKVIQ